MQSIYHSAHVLAFRRAAAIRWLQSRGLHCFTTPLHTRIYIPLHGTPLAVKENTKLGN